MVKKLTMIALAMLLTSASALARPATKGIVNATQPDGTTVGLRLIGDEYHHYNTTSDGYALVKDARGYYVYAQLNADGRLVPTTLIAHDAEARSAQELAFLQQTGRLTPQPSKQAVQLKQQNAARRAGGRDIGARGRLGSRPPKIHKGTWRDELTKTRLPLR